MGDHPHKVRLGPVGHLEGLVDPGVLDGGRARAGQGREKLGITVDEMVGLVAIDADHALGLATDQERHREDRRDPLRPRLGRV